MRKHTQHTLPVTFNNGPIVGPNGMPFPASHVQASVQGSNQVNEDLMKAIKLQGEQIAALTQQFSALTQGNDQNGVCVPEPAPNGESGLLKLQEAARKMGCFSSDELAIFSASHVSEGRTYEQSMDMIFKKKSELESQNPVINSGSVTVGLEEKDKAREGAAVALLHRWKPEAYPIEQLSENTKRFCESARSLSQLFQHVKFAQGQSAFSQSPERQIQLDLGSGTKTSDLVHIMAKVARTASAKGYKEAPKQYQPLVEYVTVSNTMDVETVGMDGDYSLLPVAEEGVYQTTTLSNAKEKYRILKSGKMVGITLENIINDHLSLFTKIPHKLGIAASNLEHKMVMASLTGNLPMSDGLKIFSDHARRGNVGTPGVISKDAVSEGRKRMGTYLDSSGNAIHCYPEYILGGVGSQTDIETFLNKISYYVENNVFANKDGKGPTLSPIISPYLDNLSVNPNGWYLAAGKDQIDIIQMAHLSYQKGVTTETLYKDNDTHYIKIRHFCGVGVLNFRGLYYNPGQGGTAPTDNASLADTDSVVTDEDEIIEP